MTRLKISADLGITKEEETLAQMRPAWKRRKRKAGEVVTTDPTQPTEADKTAAERIAASLKEDMNFCIGPVAGFDFDCGRIAELIAESAAPERSAAAAVKAELEEARKEIETLKAESGHDRWLDWVDEP